MRQTLFVSKRERKEEPDVASLMENLIAVLNQQYAEYVILLDLSQKKTTAIVENDLVNLQQITDEEQRIVGIINHYEAQRVEVMKDIANVINKDVETLKLTDLVQMLAPRPQEQKALTEIHDKLKDIALRMKRVNEQNKELLESSLEMIAFDLTLIQSMRKAPETANYNKGAYNTGSTMGNFSGSFDTKQ